jgi:hypothetical protein
MRSWQQRAFIASSVIYVSLIHNVFRLYDVGYASLLNLSGTTRRKGRPTLPADRLKDMHDFFKISHSLLNCLRGNAWYFMVRYPILRCPCNSILCGSHLQRKENTFHISYVLNCPAAWFWLQEPVVMHSLHDMPGMKAHRTDLILVPRTGLNRLRVCVSPGVNESNFPRKL